DLVLGAGDQPGEGLQDAQALRVIGRPGLKGDTVQGSYLAGVVVAFAVEGQDRGCGERTGGAGFRGWEGRVGRSEEVGGVGGQRVEGEVAAFLVEGIEPEELVADDLAADAESP